MATCGKAPLYLRLMAILGMVSLSLASKPWHYLGRGLVLSAACRSCVASVGPCFASFEDGFEAQSAFTTFETHLKHVEIHDA